MDSAHLLRQRRKHTPRTDAKHGLQIACCRHRRELSLRLRSAIAGLAFPQLLQTDAQTTAKLSQFLLHHIHRHHLRCFAASTMAAILSEQTGNISITEGARRYDFSGNEDSAKIKKNGTRANTMPYARQQWRRNHKLSLNPYFFLQQYKLVPACS